MQDVKYNFEDKEYLIREFNEKMKRDHKIPTANSIRSDYRFPSYELFKKVFDNQTIININIFKENIRKFKLLFEIEKKLCEDCPYNKESCGKKIENCKNEASLYFRKYEKI